jgi:uncharacterized membrane protein YhaH (DUF805 family)
VDQVQKALKTCFDKYAQFKGRAARPEFWWFALFSFVMVAVLGIVSHLLAGLAVLSILLPGLAVGARRLHDTDRSAWLLLLILVVFFGWLVLIYFFVQPTGPANRYGGVEVEPDAPTVMSGLQ